MTVKCHLICAVENMVIILHDMYITQERAYTKSGDSSAEKTLRTQDSYRASLYMWRVVNYC